MEIKLSEGSQDPKNLYSETSFFSLVMQAMVEALVEGTQGILNLITATRVLIVFDHFIANQNEIFIITKKK